MLQREAAKKRIDKSIPEDLLILVEHPPVVTLGRRKEDNKLPVSEEFLKAKGIELFEVERGGGVTFHGPGQLVGYPIFDLERHKKDLHWFLRQVEEGIIMTLGDFGIESERSTGYTGVWTADKQRKIASIGVHARSWVTWHGFALNVATDLSYFNLMTPCGIDGVTMTSMVVEQGMGTKPAVRTAQNTSSKSTLLVEQGTSVEGGTNAEQIQATQHITPVSYNSVAQSIGQNFATLFSLTKKDVTLSDLNISY